MNDRQQIRNRYMELSLYPDECGLSDEERLEEIDLLRAKINRFRYKSIRNFLNAIYSDAMNGILGKDPTREIIRGLRGYRDKIEWEEISTGHQLRVNGDQSPWVDRSIPAEVGGYMAFRTAKNQVRILRVFEVTHYTVVR